MKVYNVVKTLKIGKNTAVLIDDDGRDFYNGIVVLDQKGKPFKVLSVGMDAIKDIDRLLEKTSLLVEGRFKSPQLYL